MIKQYKLETYFILSVLVFSMIKSNEILFVLGLILSVFVFRRIRAKVISFTAIDLIVLLLLVFEIVNVFISLNSIQGFYTLRALTTSVLCYFLVRYSFNRKCLMNYLLTRISMLFSAILILALLIFILFQFAVSPAEFNDSYELRYLYKPFGLPLNVWGAYCIMFFGIISVTLFSIKWAQNKKVVAFLLTSQGIALFHIAVTFSRGIYLAFFPVLFLFLAIFITQLKVCVYKKIRVLTFIITPILILICLFQKEVTHVIKFTETTSQRRSIESRLDGFLLSKHVIKRNLALGVGSGNYSLIVNNRNEDSNIGFTNFAPSGLVEILVEKGLVGTLVWSLLPIAIIFNFFTRDKRVMFLPGLIILVFVSLFLRELSFPVFFNSFLLMYLTFLLLAILSNILACNMWSSSRGLYWGSLFVLIAAIIVVKSAYIYYDSVNNRKSMEALLARQLKLAICSIERTSHSTPYLINRALVYKRVFELTEDRKYLSLSEQYLGLAMDKNPFDPHIENHLACVLLQRNEYTLAYNILFKLVNQYPNNFLFKFNLSKVLFFSKDYVRAELQLKEAIKLCPQLLLNTDVQKLIAQYPSVIQKLKSELRLSLLSSFERSAPIESAKFGSIMLSLGDTVTADTYLLNSAKQLPGLSHPWLNLSIIHKSDTVLSKLYMKRYIINSIGLNAIKDIKLIRYNPMEYYKSITKSSPDFKSSSLNSSYRTQFSSWYHTYMIHLN